MGSVHPDVGEDTRLLADPIIMNFLTSLYCFNGATNIHFINFNTMNLLRRMMMNSLVVSISVAVITIFTQSIGSTCA